MQLTLHHVGILVKDIPEAAAHYVRRFGYEIKTDVIQDATQTACVQFLKLPGDAVYLELIAPDRPESKLTNALDKGGGLNHICYATDDIDAACTHLRSEGMFLIQRPVLAAAFPGRRIAWLNTREHVLVELLEKGPDNEL